jgi:hypothetical protein
MTTEAAPSQRRWRRVAVYAALVVAGWLVAVLALTFASPPGKAMAILGSPTQAIAAVAAADGRVISAGRFVTIARSDDAHFVARLYAAGALMVLDAEQAGGCSGLPPRRPAQAL